MTSEVHEKQRTISSLQRQIQENRDSKSSVKSSDELNDLLNKKDKKIADLEDRLQNMQRKLDETVESLHKETMNQASTRADWMEVQKRLTDQVNMLQHETMSQKDQIRALQATPEMNNFLALEGQVNGLEKKLARRDVELQSALEEGRKAMKFERMRLQAFHEQEMREKDEQLKGFQVDLEELISAFKAQEFRKEGVNDVEGVQNSHISQ